MAYDAPHHSPMTETAKWSDALGETFTFAVPSDFDERWLKPGAIVPVDIPTTGALVREIQRLRSQLEALREIFE